MSFRFDNEKLPIEILFLMVLCVCFFSPDLKSEVSSSKHLNLVTSHDCHILIGQKLLSDIDAIIEVRGGSSGGISTITGTVPNSEISKASKVSLVECFESSLKASDAETISNIESALVKINYTLNDTQEKKLGINRSRNSKLTYSQLSKILNEYELKEIKRASRNIYKELTHPVLAIHLEPNNIAGRQWVDNEDDTEELSPFERELQSEYDKFRSSDKIENESISIILEYLNHPSGTYIEFIEALTIKFFEHRWSKKEQQLLKPLLEEKFYNFDQYKSFLHYNKVKKIKTLKPKERGSVIKQKQTRSIDVSSIIDNNSDSRTFFISRLGAYSRLIEFYNLLDLIVYSKRYQSTKQLCQYIGQYSLLEAFVVQKADSDTASSYSYKKLEKALFKYYPRSQSKQEVYLGQMCENYNSFINKFDRNSVELIALSGDLNDGIESSFGKLLIRFHKKGGQPMFLRFGVPPEEVAGTNKYFDNYLGKYELISEDDFMRDYHNRELTSYKIKLDKSEFYLLLTEIYSKIGKNRPPPRFEYKLVGENCNYQLLNSLEVVDKAIRKQASDEDPTFYLNSRVIEILEKAQRLGHATIEKKA